MSYRVEAGRSGKAVIEVYAGEQFIVRVTGKIGYEPNAHKRSVTKFKVGHYRDYMPFVHAMARLGCTYCVNWRMARRPWGITASGVD